MVLSRDAFRMAVFERDGMQCVMCKGPGQDAHHIIERRLFPDGGYYVNNGATVCESCHIRAEQTLITVEQLREAAGITKPVLPPHLYDDQRYDKWGNPILSSGKRVRGELFEDPSVQKALQLVLNQFTTWVKYPRTWHLPWSPGMHKDDRKMTNVASFVGERVIITEKMDGENTSLYNDHIHARSVESQTHESQSWVKNMWANIHNDIPDGWRICGENLYAKHSIGYNQLPSYFLGFSIWDDKNICQSWDDTLYWFGLLDIQPVPWMYDDIFSMIAVNDLTKQQDWNKKEGYVMRVASEIPYGEFSRKVGKYVREGHISTVPHWRYGQRMEKNAIRPF